MALILAAQGVSTVLNYSRSEKEAAETAELVRAQGVSCLLHQANVADDRSVRAMIGTIVEKLGRLDYLVNAAATTDFVALTEMEGMTEESWDRTLAVKKLAMGTPLAKVCGPVNVEKVVVPVLLSAGMMTGQTVVVDGGISL